MAYSDYLAVKKQKNNNISTKFSNKRISSERTINNSYCNLQNTSTINEDGDLLENKRFLIPLCNKKIYSKYKNTLASGFSFMYSIPKIHTPEYIKNQYQPSFCWTCWTPLGEITHSIACSVCDYNDEFKQIQNDTIMNTNVSSFTDDKFIDKLLNDFDIAQDNKNKGLLYEFPSYIEKEEEEQEEKEQEEELIYIDENNVHNIDVHNIIQHFEKSILF